VNLKVGLHTSPSDGAASAFCSIFPHGRVGRKASNQKQPETYPLIHIHQQNKKYQKENNDDDDLFISNSL